MQSDYCIVVSRECFEEAFLPEGPQSRQRELRTLDRCLYPACKSRRPLNVWIHGPSGSGKTMIACAAIQKGEKAHLLRSAYVDCWQCDTLFKVADFLTQHLKILYAEQHDTLFKLDRLKRELGRKPFVVILDEIDHASPREGK